MKIIPLTAAIQSFERLKPKSVDADAGGSQGGGYGQQQKKNDQEGSREELTAKEVDQAAEEFQNDAQNQASGISATVVANGLGLKVVLKDGSGAVVRQLSGEEFMKLREATTQGTPGRGKILDQKL